MFLALVCQVRKVVGQVSFFEQTITSKQRHFSLIKTFGQLLSSPGNLFPYWSYHFQLAVFKWKWNKKGVTFRFEISNTIFKQQVMEGKVSQLRLSKVFQCLNLFWKQFRNHQIIWWWKFYIPPLILTTASAKDGFKRLRELLTLSRKCQILLRNEPSAFHYC